MVITMRRTSGWSMIGEVAGGDTPAALAAGLRQLACDPELRRRLGGLRHQQVSEQLAAGFRTGNHIEWIQNLLSWYYDPMYDYQLEKKEARIVFRGDRQAVREFLKEYQP